MLYIALFSFCFVLAQERPQKISKNTGGIIKVNPLSAIIGALSLQWEKPVSTNKSFIYYGNIFSVNYQNRFNGFGAGIGFRNYYVNSLFMLNHL